MLKRVLAVVIVAAVFGGGALYILNSEPAVPDDAPTEEAMARTIGTAVMEHLNRGHVPGRSGEVMLVPKPHSYLIGEWDLTRLGTDTVTTSVSHPNPWNYLTRVPIVLWGSGVPAEERSEETDIASIAPTFADILGMDTSPYAGAPLIGWDGVPPRMIFNIVLDGGGWNALQYHSQTWPNMRRMMETGTTFVNATIGSAPSITGALHATMGTGVYPIEHGIPGNQLRGADGKNTDAWLENADPRYLEVPTVSELWDEQNNNEPIVATVSYEGWHLGMIGHGAQREGGDHDIAVLWEAEENSWWINEEFYELPEYLQTTDLSTLESYEEGLDPRDGLEGDGWFGHDLEEIQDDTTRPATPAFVRFTGDAIEEVLRNEDFGKDSLTDIMWVEMKMPDYAGHRWNMLGAEQGDVLAETDAQVGRFIEILDDVVGAGNYLVTLTADHGQQPLPDTFGGWRINSKELERDIEDRFGPIVEKVTTVDMYLDMDAVAERDLDLSDVARYLGTYTLGDNIPDAAPGRDRVLEFRLDEALFAGAFSTDYLGSLTLEEIESFGDGDYPESDFTIGDS